jgi:small GTP-binding protein
VKIRLLTPRGSGGVAVIGCYGPGAEAILCERFEIARRSGRSIRLVTPRVDDEVLDEALLIIRAPGLVELHTHGGPALVDDMLRALATVGTVVDETPVGPEFELAGQGTDDEQAHVPALSQLLPHAPCAAAARTLLDQQNGSYQRAMQHIARAPLGRARRMAAALAERFVLMRRLLVPTRVLIAGPTNAGKSTLFNLLVGESRAIVSELAGTTRDQLHASAELEGWPFEWIDTAGEGSVLGVDAQAQVERIGQLAARAMAERVDVVLRLEPLQEASRLEEMRRFAVASEGVAGVLDRSEEALAGPPVVRLVSRLDRGDESSRAVGRDQTLGRDQALEGNQVQERDRSDQVDAAAAPGLAVSPIEDPDGSLTAVWAAVRSALDLPANAWRSGWAAPWCHSQQRALLRAALAADRDELCRSLEIALPSDCVLHPEPLSG